MMATAMVYGMEVYNGLRLFGRLTPYLLIIPINEMVQLILIVILFQSLVTGPLVRTVCRRLFSREEFYCNVCRNRLVMIETFKDV